MEELFTTSLRNPPSPDALESGVMQKAPGRENHGKRWDLGMRYFQTNLNLKRSGG